MELFDEVVRLRPLELSDASAVASACADAEIARFIPGIPVPYGLDHAEAYLREAELGWEAGTRCAFAVVEAGGVELRGTIDVGRAEVGSIGYWIARKNRGQGLATRALVLLSRWAGGDGWWRREARVDDSPRERRFPACGREGRLRTRGRSTVADPLSRGSARLSGLFAAPVGPLVAECPQAREAGLERWVCLEHPHEA